MTHLSNTTAAALKAANFPQPAPAPGQYWYTEGERLAWLQYTYPRLGLQVASFWVVGEDWGMEYTFEEIHRLTYCPTAEEILRDLGQEYYLSLFDGGFCCADCNADPVEDLPEYESAAEACAMALLANQKSKSTSA